MSLPARLHAEEAAKHLGFQPHDIPVLIAKKLLKPLGSPAPNAPKYFAAVQILELAQDIQWLDRATRATVFHWKEKNARKHNLGRRKIGNAPLPCQSNQECSS
ncbi:MAG: hypothetical protein PHV34_14640 [Verrucomicrobiae bacterium]|nr:hypothetical protein [Verrucomicrobiae bacterium]